MNLNFIAVLLGMLLAISISTAQSTQNLKLELCTDKQCYSSSEQGVVLKPEEPILLKVTIINNQDKFMCWSGLSYRYRLFFKGFSDGHSWEQGDTGVNNNNNNPQAFCFAQEGNKENIIYLPLRKYNNYGRDSYFSKTDYSSKRGEWRISDFTFEFKNLGFYDMVSLGGITTTIGTINSEYRGNDIKFLVTLDEPTNTPNLGRFNKQLKDIIKVIAVILGVITASLWGYIFTYKFKKRKPLTMAIITLILTLILAWFGFF